MNERNSELLAQINRAALSPDERNRMKLVDEAERKSSTVRAIREKFRELAEILEEAGAPKEGFHGNSDRVKGWKLETWDRTKTVDTSGQVPSYALKDVSEDFIARTYSYQVKTGEWGRVLLDTGEVFYWESSLDPTDQTLTHPLSDATILISPRTDIRYTNGRGFMYEDLDQEVHEVTIESHWDHKIVEYGRELLARPQI